MNNSPIFSKTSLRLVIVILSIGYMQSYAQYKFEWQRKNFDSHASIRGLCTVSEDVIWLSGSKGTVARSIDKGESWIILPVEGGENLDFRDIHAFDENSAIIMSSGVAAKSKVYKTVDGGQNWDLVHVNTHKNGFFNGIDFWDEENGILAGDPVDGNLYIATTSDGGDTWVKIHKSRIPTINYQEFGFAASGTHLRVFEEGQAWIGTGGQSARIFYSQDWGETWEVSDTPINQGKASTGVFSVKFIDHSFGLAVGGDYNKTSDAKNNIIITKDKGVSWSLVPEHMEFRSCIDYADGFFIAVGSAGSSYSHNNGSTWHPIDVMGFHTLSIAGKSKEAIWAAGSDGKIARLSIINTHKD